MDADTRKAATIAFAGDCMQHIRNILLDSMSSKAASFLSEELQESLDTFSSYEITRMY